MKIDYIETIRDGVNALADEYQENENRIRALQVRNLVIKQTLDNVSSNVGGVATSQKARRAKPKKVHEITGTPALIIEAMQSGDEMSIASIGRAIFGAGCTQTQINHASNACRTLINAGRVIRVSRGVYRLKYARRNGESKVGKPFPVKGFLDRESFLFKVVSAFKETPDAELRMPQVFERLFGRAPSTSGEGHRVYNAMFNAMQRHNLLTKSPDGKFKLTPRGREVLAEPVVTVNEDDEVEVDIPITRKATASIGDDTRVTQVPPGVN